MISFFMVMKIQSVTEECYLNHRSDIKSKTPYRFPKPIRSVNILTIL